MIAFLDFRQHLCVAARVCKAFKAAAQTKQSWSKRVDLLGIPRPTGLSFWAESWRFYPKAVACSMQWLTRPALTGVAVQTITVDARDWRPNFHYETHISCSQLVWQAHNFPSLTSLSISHVVECYGRGRVCPFDGTKADLPLLRELTIEQGSEAVWVHLRAVPQLRSIRFTDVNPGLHESVLPFVTEVTISVGEEQQKRGRPFQCVLNHCTQRVKVILVDANERTDHRAVIEWCNQLGHPVSVLLHAAPSAGLVRQLAVLPVHEIVFTPWWYFLDPGVAASLRLLVETAQATKHRPAAAGAPKRVALPLVTFRRVQMAAWVAHELAALRKMGLRVVLEDCRVFSAAGAGEWTARDAALLSATTDPSVDPSARRPG
jgi:hypothetical protein